MLPTLRRCNAPMHRRSDAPTLRRFRAPLRITRGLACLLVSLSLWAGLSGRALEAPDIPSDAPQDAIMASPEEVQAMQDWVSAAFTGRELPGSADSVSVELRRQDYGRLGFGQSCVGTSIKIGPRSFEHGLGTHANSEIVLYVPAEAKEFKAFVGINNDPDTGGVRGSVQFIVAIAGAEVFRSPTLRGTNGALEVRVPLPEGTREVTLKTDTTPDGASYDHADWADACIVTGNGRICWADEDKGPRPFMAAAIPFSFRLGGQPSASFLPEWRQAATTNETSTRTVREVVWTDPKTALRVNAAVVAFKRYPAAEWVLSFENLGDRDTPPIEEVQALDVQLRTSCAEEPVRLHHLIGDVCSERSFLPQETEVEQGKPVTLAPKGGRPLERRISFLQCAIR